MSNIDTKALFNIGYGLYVLTAHENGKDNGCIINTVMQVTSSPSKIAIAVNKENFTCSMVQHTKKFNVSVISEKADFSLFKHFGFQSGRNVDKFMNFLHRNRSDNGVFYITKTTNAYFSAYVQEEVDLGTHILFVAQLVDAKVLSEEPTATYTYYQNNIKPKPEQTSKKGWRCKICGYIYENDILPIDFVCPICKHGVEDFEKI